MDSLIHVSPSALAGQVDIFHEALSSSRNSAWPNL